MQRRELRFLFLVFVAAMTLVRCMQTPEKLKPTYVIADEVEDIEVFRDSLIKPVDYINLISLEQLPIPERKAMFIQQILPSILICKYNLEVQKRYVERIIRKDTSHLSHRHKRYLDSLFVKYKTKNPKELLKRLSTHPVSIVLAQAALESAWGTSRFYSEGNNAFGIWSFNETDNRIASKELRDGKPVFVRRYRSISESVEDYFLLISRGPFREFRRKRVETDDPLVLVNLLDKYSEKGKDYPKLLKSIIRRNELTKYDGYKLNPKFIN